MAVSTEAKENTFKSFLSGRDGVSSVSFVVKRSLHESVVVKLRFPPKLHASHSHANPFTQLLVKPAEECCRVSFGSY